MAPLALDAVAVEEVAAVEVAAEKIQGVIAVFPVEGKQAASKLFVVLPHTFAAPVVGEDAAAAAEVRSLDIVVLVFAEEHPGAVLAFVEGPACGVEYHGDAVEEVGRYEDCR